MEMGILTQTEKECIMAFDDFFSNDDFVLDVEELEAAANEEPWDTGVEPDVFATGENPDIFSTGENPDAFHT
jgi:hypothetical protein